MPQIATPSPPASLSAIKQLHGTLTACTALPDDTASSDMVQHQFFWSHRLLHLHGSSNSAIHWHLQMIQYLVTSTLKALRHNAGNGGRSLGNILKG